MIEVEPISAASAAYALTLENLPPFGLRWSRDAVAVELLGVRAIEREAGDMDLAPVVLAISRDRLPIATMSGLC